MLKALRNARRPPYESATFWGDLRAGIALSTSYIPTAMALGYISGMGPIAGLWCGVFVGIMAALCGGTRALVSGPSVPMAVVTAALIAGNDFTFAELAVVIVMAGAIQIALGLVGVGRFISYIPYIVLTGFMTGVGVLLVWTQIQSLFRFGLSDLVVAGCGVALLVMWPARVGRYLPPALAVVAIGWLMSRFIPGVEPLGPVPTGLPIPVLEAPSLEFLANAAGPAAIVALISSVYSLMLALTTDTLTGSQHNSNRELFGLGLGNIAAGIVGVLPGSANISTMTSHRFGGKTVVAGIICQVIVAGLILQFASYIAPLPLAALSAIVIFVGWRLIDFSFLSKIRGVDIRHSAVMLLTMAVTIFIDPILAIVFGVVAANVVNAARLETLELDSVISTPLLDATFSVDADDYEARIGLLAFRGTFTVASSRKLIQSIGQDIRDHEVVIFDLTDTAHVDDSAAHLLALLLDRAKQTNTEIVACGVTDRIRKTLYSFGVLDRIPRDRLVETQKDAKELAWTLL